MYRKYTVPAIALFESNLAILEFHRIYGRTMKNLQQTDPRSWSWESRPIPLTHPWDDFRTAEYMNNVDFYGNM